MYFAALEISTPAVLAIAVVFEAIGNGIKRQIDRLFAAMKQWHI